jgi:hypothetical protein
MYVHNQQKKSVKQKPKGSGEETGILIGLGLRTRSFVQRFVLCLTNEKLWKNRKAITISARRSTMQE